MKKRLYILLFFISSNAIAQVEVGSATTENAKAEFFITSPTNNKGVLIPRMTYANLTAIASPAEGLLVYNSDNDTFYYFNGTTWVRIGQTCTIIQDENADTKVTVEYNADEDIVRFFAKGIEVIDHASTGVTQLAGNLYIPNGTLKIGSAYSLPIVDGLSKYVLTTNGTGTLSWQNPATLPGLVCGLQSIPLGLGRTFSLALQDKAYLTAIIPWSNISINHISAYISIVGSPNLEIGIYDDKTLLSSGTLIPGASGFITVTLSSQVRLKAGTLYRVAIIDRNETGTIILTNFFLPNPSNWTLWRVSDGLGANPNHDLPATIGTHTDGILNSVWFCLY
jgi:hypothetical protein